MYTSIPNSEGIKAVKLSLENFARRTVATKVITTFLSLIWTLTWTLILSQIEKKSWKLKFLFCKNYLQIKCCAMGTICSLAYAYIFMDHFERKYNTIFTGAYLPILDGLSRSYLRFIDDIFFI